MSDLFVSIGAGPGMGLSTAERFAREGFDLVLTSRDLTRLQSSAEQLRKNTGRRVETVALDASSVDGVQRLAETYGAKTGVLHYNAAAMQKTDLLDSSLETMKQNLSVDILGAPAAVKYFAPFMETKQKGNNSSHRRRPCPYAKRGVPVPEHRKGRYPLHDRGALPATVGERDTPCDTDRRGVCQCRFTGGSRSSRRILEASHRSGWGLDLGSHVPVTARTCIKTA